MNERVISGIVRAGLVTLLCAPCAIAGATAPAIPANLQVPDTQQLALEVDAVGVQIYDCKASKNDPYRMEWVFRAPEAELFDTAGRKLGQHYGGPTWESGDGSKVVAEARARDDGPDPQAIPWLLLTAKDRQGSGVFGNTLSVQRVNTSGGKAPGEGCTQAQLGSALRVPYKAKYLFYTARP